MIGHRIAAVGRLPGPVSGRHELSAPAVAGRRHLASVVQGSLLMQLMAAMVLIAIAFVIYLYQASQASVLEFSIQDLQQTQLQLSSQNAALQAQLGNLQSTQRIDSIASTQLQMVKPSVPPVWLQPTVPRFTASPPAEVSVGSARQESQPLAWMHDAISFVASSF